MAFCVRFLRCAIPAFSVLFCFSLSSSVAADSWNSINTGLANTVVRAVVIHPSYPQILYAGTAGGFFRSADSGATWEAGNSGLGSVNVTSIAVDPLDDRTVYVGTGSGVYRSTDLGGTWTRVLNAGTINAVAAFAYNSDTVLLAAPADGYISRSPDGGSTWERSTGFDEDGGNAVAFVVDPKIPSIVYAALSTYAAIKSTDSGLTWGYCGTPLPSKNVVSIAIDPSSPGTLYSGPEYNGVWKAINARDSFFSWSESSHGFPSGATAVAVKVDPANPEIVYAGTNGRGVYRSADSGETWTAYNVGLTSLTVSPQAMAIDPQNPSTVYVGTNGGIFRYGPAPPPRRPADTICYPQLAVGGGYEVVLLIENNSSSAWRGRAEPLLKDGSLDFLVTDLSLAAGETRKMTFSGGSETKATGLEIFGYPGYPTSALSVAYFFNYFENGKLTDTFGLPKGQGAEKFTLPVEETAAISTGVAARRLPYETDSSVTLTLRDAQGKQIGRVTRSCDFAAFVFEIFPGLPEGFIGSMTVESDTRFFMTVLRMEEQPGGGVQFTSCPPEPR